MLNFESIKFKMTNQEYFSLKEIVELLYEFLPDLATERKRKALEKIQHLENHLDGWETGEQEETKSFWLENTEKTGGITTGTINDASPSHIDLVLKQQTTHDLTHTELRLTIEDGRLKIKTKVRHHSMAQIHATTTQRLLKPIS